MNCVYTKWVSFKFSQDKVTLEACLQENVMEHPKLLCVRKDLSQSHGGLERPYQVVEKGLRGSNKTATQIQV